MNGKHALIGLGVLELVVAVTWPGVYLSAYYFFPPTGIEFSFTYWFFAVEGALFILAPMAGFFAVTNNLRIGIHFLAIYPVFAFIHGISVIPWISHIAPIGNVRSLVVFLVNTGAVIFAYWVSSTKSGRFQEA